MEIKGLPSKHSTFALVDHGASIRQCIFVAWCGGNEVTSGSKLWFFDANVLIPFDRRHEMKHFHAKITQPFGKRTQGKEMGGEIALMIPPLTACAPIQSFLLGQQVWKWRISAAPLSFSP